MDDRMIGYELITVGHLIKRERDRTEDIIKRRVLGDDEDVMCSDLRIVKYLADNQDKEIYQKNIEKFFSLTAPSVSNKLRDLENKGLVTRVYSKKDTRLKQVILTDKGIDIDTKMMKDIKEFENLLKSFLSNEEQTQLITIVDKIKKGFE